VGWSGDFFSCGDVGADDVDAGDLAVLDLGDAGLGDAWYVGQRGLRDPGTLAMPFLTFGKL
jgi:hypothetical protein